MTILICTRNVEPDLILALAGWWSQSKHESSAEPGDDDEDHPQGVPRGRGDVLLALEHEEALQVADQQRGHRHRPEDCRVPEEKKVFFFKDILTVTLIHRSFGL